MIPNGRAKAPVKPAVVATTVGIAREAKSIFAIGTSLLDAIN